MLDTCPERRYSLDFHIYGWTSATGLEGEAGLRSRYVCIPWGRGEHEFRLPSARPRPRGAALGPPAPLLGLQHDRRSP